MCVLREKIGKVIYLTLDYPEKKNGLDLELAYSLLSNIKKANEDPEIYSIVFQSNQRAYFSVGPRPEDLIKCVGETGSTYLRKVLNLLNQCVLEIFNSPKVTIALINGYAYGGGFNFLLACDKRIAVRRAKFLENFHVMGISPDLGASFLIPDLIGYDKTFNLLIKGELLSANEAWQLGLVNEVAENKTMMYEKLEDFLKKVEEGYLPAIEATKRLLKDKASITLQDHMEQEMEALLKLFKQDEIKKRLEALV